MKLATGQCPNCRVDIKNVPLHLCDGQKITCCVCGTTFPPNENTKLSRNMRREEIDSELEGWGDQ